MSTFRRAEKWGPEEPAPQPADRTGSATIKPLTGIRGPHPTPVSPADADTTAARFLAADRTPQNARRNRAIETGWASIQPEVLGSCSVALRRLGDSDVTSIAVTSTSRGEGRTTVAVGLAAAASMELRRKTILLDLDLDRGDIEGMTSSGPGPGVTEFLFREATIEECLQPVGPQVEIVRAGLRRDPSGIATRMGRMTELIQELGERCDVLIADLPPLSSGITTARLTDLFQSVTLVVRAGEVAVADIQETASVLTQRPFVILNGTAMPPSSRLRKILRFRG